MKRVPPAVEALRAPRRQKPAWTNKQAPNPEPPEPVAPYLSHPLLDDNTRSQELNERGGLHWRGISDSDKEDFFNFQLLIEKGIERALLSDGYSRASLNDKNIIYKIGGFFLVLPKGDPSFWNYKKHAEEVVFAAHRSIPYRRIMKAISYSKLILQKEIRHKF